MTDYKTLADEIITSMADSLTVKTRFDIGEGYCKNTYNKIKILKRVLDSTNEDLDLQPVKEYIKKTNIKHV